MKTFQQGRRLQVPGLSSATRPFLVLLMSFISLTGGINDHRCTEGEVLQICVPVDYMKFELPEQDESTFVSIGVDIKDIPKVNDKDFSITINAYFIVKWKDDRLIVTKRNRTRRKYHGEEVHRDRPTPMPLYQRDLSKRKSTTRTTMTSPIGREVLHSTPLTEETSKLTAVNIAILRNLWLPDVEILNLKEFETHSVLSKLEGIWIDNQNQLMYALATRITFICPMKFNAFPMDIQVCKFQVGSFNYDMSKMVFSNEFVPREEDAIKSILDYAIQIKDLRPDQTHYMALGMNYSVAGFEMVLTRKISFYVVTYYLPSGLFVVVSWISFLVNPEVIPGRMTLLVTIFLVLINIFNTIQTNSPKAEGLTAIEAWVIACIIFVFGALGEYTVILLKIKLKKIAPRRRKHQATTTNTNPATGGGGGGSEFNNVATMTTNSAGVTTTTTTTNNPVRSPSGRPYPSLHGNRHMRRDNYGRTDLIFLVVFPVLFGIFNVFYWVSLYWWRWSDQLIPLD